MGTLVEENPTVVTNEVNGKSFRITYLYPGQVTEGYIKALNLKPANDISSAIFLMTKFCELGGHQSDMLIINSAYLASYNMADTFALRDSDYRPEILPGDEAYTEETEVGRVALILASEN